ncbi:DUF6064 family protein [Benzoatithermus flavus]|uniref:DUF6064 family protein n=1 Tax=Benzoatithermus flavus TaxID=3108223 RepID=A0ABU8XPJ3_9PROT
MPEWRTYTLEDFLLFSPRVYWRMFELHNAAVWPLQIPALLLGAAILVRLVRPRSWSDRVIPAILAAAWLWVAWSFLWNRYATINWAMRYVAPVFAAEALLLLWLGSLRGRLRFALAPTAPSAIGLALLAYALVLHPLVAGLAGRSIRATELFAITPDPTAIATLGLVLLAGSGAVAWPLLVLPLVWCVLSWATLHTMGAPEGWIPLAAAGLAVAGRLWPRVGGQAGLLP